MSYGNPSVTSTLICEVPHPEKGKTESKIYFAFMMK
ncbi:hypothetical protein ABFA07_009617 [Porites harrisoni]